MPLECFAQEPFGSREVPPRAGPEFSGVTVAVDGAIEISPLVSNFDVGLVNMPSASDNPLRELNRSNSAGEYRMTHLWMAAWSPEMPRSAIISLRSRRLRL
jgi:hypothetical protein